VKIVSLQALSVLSLVLALGCDKLLTLAQKAGPAGSAASGAGAAADPSISADAKLGEKLEAYLTGCLNSTARLHFRLAANNYLDSVDDQAGPSDKRIPNLYKVELKYVEECAQAALQAKAMQPALAELDAAVAAYVAAIQAGAPTVNEAVSYYEQKDYKDDKFAKGRAWHPQLVALFKQVTSLSQAMSVAFTKQKGPLDTRELERLRIKGPKLVYVTKRSVMDADAFEKLLTVTSVKEFFALPPADLQTQVDILTRDLAELQQLLDSKGNELKGTMFVDSYASELGKYLGDAKAVTRRIRDQAKFSDSELERIGTTAGSNTEGSPDKLERQHSRLIDAYNRMRL
jgi:hypothetical protein